EECDTGDPCPAGGKCTATCACLLPGATTTSTTSTTPTLPPCGNGVLDPGEQAADANPSSAAASSPGCQQETTEGDGAEPNTAAGQATPLVTLPARVRAALDPAGDVDYFAITVTAGTRLHLETFDGSGVACDGVDTYLELCNTDGLTAIAGSDDDGIGLCS